MQLLLALLSVVLPVFFIEFPHARNSLAEMGSIGGTYDVLLVALTLPRAQVLQLLPENLRHDRDKETSLLYVDDHHLKALRLHSDDDHINEKNAQTADAGEQIVLLQLGYQQSTGPGPSWLPKLSFSEAKLEVPYMRHQSDDSDTSFVFKQKILFSNSIISLGSSASGLTSAAATFNPSKSPSGYPQDAEQISYEVQGYVSAQAHTPPHPIAPDLALASWSLYRDWLQAWWFGIGTGNTVQKFDFDFDEKTIPAHPYLVTVEINLQAYQPQSKELPTTVTQQAIGWRVRSKFASKAKKLDKAAK